MFRTHPVRWLRLCCLLGVLFSVVSQTPARQLTTVEPVEKLRQALRTPVLDQLNRDEIAFRKSLLEKAIQGLRPADYGPALNLPEWRDLDKEEAVAAVDQPLRRALIKDLMTWVAGVLKQPGPDNVDRKLAVLTLLGRMGVQVRGEAVRSNLASDLGPVVIAALSDDDSAVRQRAARTLGKIHSQPEPAVAALTKMLGSKEAGDRRAAAEALAEMARLVERLAKDRGSIQYLVEMSPAEIVLRCQLLTVAAGRGLSDADAPVKRSCLEALQRTAKTFHDLLGESPKAEDFPPAGRKPSPEERKQLEHFADLISRERKTVGPLSQALNEQVKAIAVLFSESDQGVLLAVCQTLEEYATARARAKQRAAVVAAILQAGEQKPPADPVLDKLPQVVPALAGLLTHPEIRIRLAALYVLETLEAEAIPAAPALVKACTDTDAFVRWGAVRALGKIAPAEAKSVVPALAKLADDPNGDVRITALAALERYGPSASAAVPALGQAAAKGDVPTRIWAMRALSAIGKDAQAAVPSLISALSATEPELRTAAARTLGKVGHGSAEARKALRKALDDPSGEVQEAASQALLAVQ